MATRPDRVYAAYVFDRFVSNNPTRDPEQYAAKLTRVGIPTPAEAVVNTTVTTTRWLLEHHAGAVVFPIAEAPLVDALAAAGIRMSDDPAEIDVVVSSYDRAFDYRKLQIAFDAIWFHRRAVLVATNPDRFCPLPHGRGEPDCAAVTAAIEACTGTTAAATLGKPDAAILDTALAGLDVAPSDTLVVGDRLATDIRLGRAAGMPTALVLTGDTGPEALAAADPAEAPDYVLDRGDHVLPAAAWRRLGWAEE